ncbi:MAG: hypothetical protein ACJ76H_14920 [Bacteriovoracaceae bacterium]
MKFLGLFMIIIACSSYDKKIAKDLGSETLALKCEPSANTTHLAYVGLQGPFASEELAKEVMKELDSCGCRRWDGAGDTDKKMCVGYREAVGRSEILQSDNNSLYEISVIELTSNSVSYNVKIYKVQRPGRPSATRDLYQIAHPGVFTKEIKGEMTPAKNIADTIQRLTFK